MTTPFRRHLKYWDRLCSLQPYSFWLGENPARVMRVPDSTGQWIERHKAQEVVDDAQTEMEELRAALSAMLTQMGMDEDEWNRPTFDQARRALGMDEASVKAAHKAYKEAEATAAIPVAWIWQYANGEEEVVFVDIAKCGLDPTECDVPAKVTPLYTAPPPSTPSPLVSADGGTTQGPA